MRRKIKIIVPLMLVLLLVSCAPRYGENLRISFKENKSSNSGYSAAVYNERIYYISNEQGDAGIYSMNADGSDIRKEAVNPSITRLEISNDILYFSGLNRIEDRQGTIQSSTINMHALYQSPLENETGKISKSNMSNENYNIMGFYISGQGYKACSFGATAEELSLFDTKSRFIDRTDSSIKITTISFKYDDMDVYKDVYDFGDLLILSDHYPDNVDYYKFTGSSYPHVVDTSTGELELTYHSGTNQENALKVFYMDEGSIYCSYNETILVLDRMSYDIKTSIIPEGISKDYSIESILKYRDTVYIVADKWWKTKYKTLPLLNEKLYQMDPNTYECKEVLNLARNQRIVGLDENYIILLDDGQIFKSELNNGIIGDREKLIDAPADMNTKNYTIDYAGNWMFIYKMYPENGAVTYGSDPPGQQLLFKINLQNGKVITNNEELDFSVLNAYK